MLGDLQAGQDVVRAAVPLGLSGREVQEYLELLAKSWEKQLQTEKELNDKIARLNEEIARWRAKESEIDKIREQAHEEAQAIREQARQEAKAGLVEVEERANQIREKTEEWLESVIAEVEEAQRQKLSFMTAFKSALDSHYALLNKAPTEEPPIGARLNHFLRGELNLVEEGSSKH